MFLYCSVLQCAAVYPSVLQCVAVCCSVLQCVAVCRSVLQYIAVCWLLRLSTTGSAGRGVDAGVVGGSVYGGGRAGSGGDGTPTVGEKACRLVFANWQYTRHSVVASVMCVDVWHGSFTWVTWRIHMRHDSRRTVLHGTMGWLQSVGSIKLQVSFAEYCLFYRALLQKRPIV